MIGCCLLFKLTGTSPRAGLVVGFLFGLLGLIVPTQLVRDRKLSAPKIVPPVPLTANYWDAGTATQTKPWATMIPSTARVWSGMRATMRLLSGSIR